MKWWRLEGLKKSLKYFSEVIAELKTPVTFANPNGKRETESCLGVGEEVDILGKQRVKNDLK